MKRQDKCEATDQPSQTEDLTLSEDQAAAVKGGAAIYRNVNGCWTLISSDVAV